MPLRIYKVAFGCHHPNTWILVADDYCNAGGAEATDGIMMFYLGVPKYLSFLYPFLLPHQYLHLTFAGSL